MTQLEETPITVEDPLCQFALRRAIDDILDDLIVAGAEKVVLLQNNRSKSGKLRLTRSQIKNVITVASETRSREAVTNFVRYQMGRQGEGGDAWRDKARGHEAFGREVISDIEAKEGLTSAIDEAMRKVCDAVKMRLHLQGKVIKEEAELYREARAQLTRFYLGYLNRTYAYVEMNDSADPGCWDDVDRIAKREKEASDV